MCTRQNSDEFGSSRARHLADTPRTRRRKVQTNHAGPESSLSACCLAAILVGRRRRQAAVGCHGAIARSRLPWFAPAKVRAGGRASMALVRRCWTPTRSLVPSRAVRPRNAASGPAAPESERESASTTRTKPARIGMSSPTLHALVLESGAAAAADYACRAENERTDGQSGSLPGRGSARRNQAMGDQSQGRDGCGGKPPAARPAQPRPAIRVPEPKRGA